jgi:hypothetical protein
LPRSSLFMVGKAQKSHGARCELNSVFRLEKVDRWSPIRTYAIQSRSLPMRFMGFFNNENGALRQEISKWSTVCSTFSRSGWSVVRSAWLTKGGISKKRPSPHLHKVPTGSNKVSPRTSQTAVVRREATWGTRIYFGCSEAPKLHQLCKFSVCRCSGVAQLPEADVL